MIRKEDLITAAVDFARADMAYMKVINEILKFDGKQVALVTERDLEHLKAVKRIRDRLEDVMYTHWHAAVRESANARPEPVKFDGDGHVPMTQQPDSG